MGCGVRENHELVCWGTASGGDEPVPTGKFLDVRVGPLSCALREDHSVACWTPNMMSRNVPPPPEGPIEQLSWPCALRPDGTMTCWGLDWTPQPGQFRRLAGNGTHLCGVRLDGTITCWAYQGFPAPAPPDGTFTDVAVSGLGDVCGLRADGTIACTGCKADGMGRFNCGIPVPPAWLPRGPFRKIAAEEDCICGITSTDRLQCWNPTVPDACAPIVTKSGIATDLSQYCTQDSRGVLYCGGIYAAIDLDDP
jgi:hypothetical protein